jgi:hypothetical protein
MNVRYRVELSQAERGELTAMLSKGKQAVRKLKRAQILRAADAGRSDEEIARTVAVGGSTVYRTIQCRLYRGLASSASSSVSSFRSQLCCTSFRSGLRSDSANSRR